MRFPGTCRLQTNGYGYGEDMSRKILVPYRNPQSFSGTRGWGLKSTSRIICFGTLLPIDLFVFCPPTEPTSISWSPTANCTSRYFWIWNFSTAIVLAIDRFFSGLLSVDVFFSASFKHVHHPSTVFWPMAEAHTMNAIGYFVFVFHRVWRRASDFFSISLVSSWLADSICLCLIV